MSHFPPVLTAVLSMWLYFFQFREYLAKNALDKLKITR